MKTLKEIKEIKDRKRFTYWSKLLLEISSVIVYKLQKYDFSPNWITLLRLIISIIAGILIIKQQYLLGGILISLSYLGDVVDGHWARLKHRCTKMGGLFDGITDKILWLVIVLSILCSNFSKVNGLIVIGIISLRFICQSFVYSYRLVFIGLQKDLHGSQEEAFRSETIKGKGIIKFIRVMIGKVFYMHTFLLIVPLLLILNMVKWFFIYALVREIVAMISILLVVIRLTKEEKKELSVKKGCR